MTRKPTVQGCDQAVFPFSVARTATAPSPTPLTTHPVNAKTACIGSANGDAVTPPDVEEAAHLYLSLGKGERVRVLQRDSSATSALTAAQDSSGSSIAAVSAALTQWCLAQREDGAVGLVPLALLHRVPGRPFKLHHEIHNPQSKDEEEEGAVCAAEMAAHRDPTLPPMTGTVMSGVAVATISGGVAGEGGTRKAPMARRDMGNDVDEDIEDALQLQRRRQSSLTDRLAALQSPCAQTHASREPPATPLSAHHAPLCSSATRDTVVAPARDDEAAERRRLLRESAALSAELRWLERDLLPQLRTACEAAEERAMVSESAVEETQISSRRGASAPCDEGGKGDAELSRSKEALLRWVAAAQRLQRWLESRTELCHAGMNEDTGNSISTGAGGRSAAQHGPSKTNTLTDCDINVFSQKGTALKEEEASFSFLPFDTTTRDSYVIEQLCSLAQAELDAIGARRAEEKTIQQHLRELEALTAELRQEESALEPSETALQGVVAAQEEQAADPAAHSWPQSLPGLTGDEAAALHASVTTFAKYSRKLSLLHHPPPSTSDRTDASVDRTATTSADRAPVSSLTTTPEKAGATTGCHGEQPWQSSSALSPSSDASVALIEHLQRVLDKGDAETAQLRAKVEALQDFDSTYGAAAREIETQLNRGQALLEEKRRHLERL